MTGYTVHTGSSVKFSNGWDRIFAGGGGNKRAKKAATQKRAKSANSRSKPRKAK